MQDQGESQAFGTYMLPRRPSEVDRLDVQHYALREALGANYLAPVKGPALVLDVGSGTGQWAFGVRGSAEPRRSHASPQGDTFRMKERRIRTIA
jgi:hypothetical protein